MGRNRKGPGLSRRKRRQGWLLLAPALLAFAVCYLLPFGIALARSFFRGMGSEFVGLANYAELLQNRTFGLAVRNLAALWAVVLPLDLGLGFVLAALSNKARCERARAAFLLPAVLPAACVAGIVQEWQGTAQGRGLLPFFPAGWQESPAAGLVFALVAAWKGLGYTVVILAAALASIPQEYRQAARIEGASGIKILQKIDLPLLRPALGACAVLAIYNSFRCFREALLLGGTHPAEPLYGLQHFLQNNFTNMNFARLEAASVLLVGAPAAAGWLLYCWLKRHKSKKEVCR